jgi:hypothetical protein
MQRRRPAVATIRSATQQHALVKELVPYLSWTLRFSWQRKDCSPNGEWLALYNRNQEFTMWQLTFQQHQAVLHLIFYMIRGSTAKFCDRVRFHQTVSVDGAMVPVVEKSPSAFILTDKDDIVLADIYQKLRNPFLKICLPVGFWQICKINLYI